MPSNLPNFVVLGRALRRGGRPSGRCRASATVGIVKKNVVPRPTALRTQMRPPWASINTLDDVKSQPGAHGVRRATLARSGRRHGAGHCP